MDPLLNLKVALGLLSLVVLLILIVLGVECIRVVIRVRKMADRLDFLTDAKEWLNVLTFFKRKKK
jgi:hypothetical protein